MGKREENRERKRRAILAAGLDVFSARGYAAANIAQIAVVAGVGKGTIYEYHRSKEELFFAVFQWYVENLAESSAEAARQAAGEPGQAQNQARQLRTMLDTILEGGVSQLDYFSITLEFWAAAGTPELRDRFSNALLNAYRTFQADIARRITAGQESGVFHAGLDAVSVAAGIVGAMDGLLLQAWMDRDFDVRRAAREYFDTVMRGMAASHTGGAS